ncbi:hypothetical protein GC722_09590 [Auraticoccus sp. F435]|uniref:Uncharacterized protein n=1 Tax=Auraticoccus cholistanensis TaxID=2656650 RepID=A0A6A9UTL8_9ACTN|nr:hypothetical protein [Auraticoccus cholistanensis]MVA76276.1 hypothetical protein [Auraticoccus cholistanensis]
MDAVEVAQAVREHFGPRQSQCRLGRPRGLPAAEQAVTFVLYDAHVVTGAQDDYGSGTSWGFGVVLPGGVSISTVLGERLTLVEPRREALARTFDVIDRYARLRLGAEYLAAWEAAQEGQLASQTRIAELVRLIRLYGGVDAEHGCYWVATDHERQEPGVFEKVTALVGQLGLRRIRPAPAGMIPGALGVAIARDPRVDAAL